MTGAATMLPPPSEDAPVALCAGPHSRTQAPTIELAFAGGRIVSVQLDPAHARAFALRLLECVDGRVFARPLDARVLELSLARGV